MKRENKHLIGILILCLLLGVAIPAVASAIANGQLSSIALSGYSRTLYFSDGLVQARGADGKVGLVDSEGNVKVPLIYESIDRLTRNCYRVTKLAEETTTVYRYTGVVDGEGRVLLAPGSYYLYYQGDGVLLIREYMAEEQLRGLLRTDGSWLLPMGEYAYLSRMGTGEYMVNRNDGMSGVLRTDGSWLLEPGDYYGVYPAKTGYYMVVANDSSAHFGEILPRGILREDGTWLLEIGPYAMWWWSDGYQLYHKDTGENSFHTWDGAVSDRYTVTGRSDELYELYDKIEQMNGYYRVTNHGKNGQDRYGVLDAAFNEIVPPSHNSSVSVRRLDGRTVFYAWDDIPTGVEGETLQRLTVYGTDGTVLFARESSHDFKLHSPGKGVIQLYEYDGQNELIGYYDHDFNELLPLDAYTRVGKFSPSGYISGSSYRLEYLPTGAYIFDAVTRVYRNGELIAELEGLAAYTSEEHDLLVTIDKNDADRRGLASPEGEELVRADYSDIRALNDDLLRLFYRYEFGHRVYKVFDMNSRKLLPLKCSNVEVTQNGLLILKIWDDVLDAEFYGVYDPASDEWPLHTGPEEIRSQFGQFYMKLSDNEHYTLLNAELEPLIEGCVLTDLSTTYYERFDPELRYAAVNVETSTGGKRTVYLDTRTLELCPELEKDCWASGIGEDGYYVYEDAEGAMRIGNINNLTVDELTILNVEPDASGSAEIRFGVPEDLLEAAEGGARCIVAVFDGHHRLRGLRLEEARSGVNSVTLPLEKDWTVSVFLFDGENAPLTEAVSR